MRRAGFFITIVVALPLLALSACDHDGASLRRSDEKGPREIVLTNDTVKLPDSVHVATVRLDRTKREEIEPAQVTVRTGDLVRFIASDGGAHAIAFDGELLEPNAREFLERTGQMRSPPFVASGARWVVSFKDAPPGKYTYRCPTHGVQAEVMVTAR
jgi:plastocyanin